MPRDSANNPTEVIHRLLQELSIYIAEFESIQEWIARNPTATAIDIPLPHMEHYEFTAQMERRKILTMKLSRAARDNMRRVRYRQEQNQVVRHHNQLQDTKPILDKIDEQMKRKPTIMPGTTYTEQTDYGKSVLDIKPGSYGLDDDE